MIITENTILTKLRAGTRLSGEEVKYIWDHYDIYDEKFVEPYKHGANFIDFIFKIAPNEYYSVHLIHHDGYGVQDFDAQVCHKVEQHKVTITEWFEVD